MHKLSSEQSCHEVWLSKLPHAQQGVPDDEECSFVSLKFIFQAGCCSSSVTCKAWSVWMQQWPSPAWKNSEALHTPAGQNTPFSSKQQAKPSLEAQLGFMPHRNLESLQEDAPPLGSSPSAASLSSQSFASALSKDMQAQDAPSGRLAVTAML